jgi:hypothetical protein
MKYKLQKFVSMYLIVYVTFMQVLVVVVVVALMNQKCTEEIDRTYITQMESYICVQIYAVMLLVYLSSPLREAKVTFRNFTASVLQC